jgi:hypothetical protein
MSIAEKSNTICIFDSRGKSYKGVGGWIKVLGVGTISPAELKKLRRCGSFDLSGPIIYQRL